MGCTSRHENAHPHPNRAGRGCRAACGQPKLLARGAGRMHAGRFVNAALNALTPGQNAAIQATNLLLQGESGFYQTYLPDIQR